MGSLCRRIHPAAKGPSGGIFSRKLGQINHKLDKLIAAIERLAETL